MVGLTSSDRFSLEGARSGCLTRDLVLRDSIQGGLYRVVDVETTGLDPQKDAVLELAWAIVRGDGEVLSLKSTLVNPGRPIPAEASRIHGILDEHVAAAPTLSEILRRQPELSSPVMATVCHNAAFDSVFLRRAKPSANVNGCFLCTLRLAQNLVPGLESYKLDSLRSHLELPLPKVGVGPHRAAYDVALTASLLAQLISRYLSAGHPENDLDGLLRMSKLQRMPFGKYRGLLLSQVPTDYVEWLLVRDIDEELRGALCKAIRPRVASRPAVSQAPSSIASLRG